jgi:hypothetical protein
MMSGVLKLIRDPKNQSELVTMETDKTAEEVTASLLVYVHANTQSHL